MLVCPYPEKNRELPIVHEDSRVRIEGHDRAWWEEDRDGCSAEELALWGRCYDVVFSEFEKLESPGFELICADTQSGKTNQGIIAPTVARLGPNSITIIVQPSRLSIAEQTISRFQKPILDCDNLQLLSESEREFCKDFTGLALDRIVRWDTGGPGVRTFPKDIEIASTVESIEKDEVDVILVLDNHTGISKLTALLYELDSMVDIQLIIDEVHTVLNLDNRHLKRHTIITETIDSLSRPLERSSFPEVWHSASYWGWILGFWRKTRHNLILRGLTATSSMMVTKKSLWKKMNCAISVRELSPPAIYRGFDDFDWKIYDIGKRASDKLMRAAFSEILKKSSCIAMCHGRTRQTSHQTIGNIWMELCSQSKRSGVFIDNGNGYTLKYCGKDFIFKKKNYPEPWMFIRYLLNRGIDQILVTGKLCLNMSNTYQNSEGGVRVTDLVFISDFCVQDSAETLQELGRMTGCDASQSSRTVHTTNYFRNLIELAVKLEKKVRSESISRGLVNLDLGRL